MTLSQGGGCSYLSNINDDTASLVCKETNGTLADLRMEEASWDKVWGLGEGWLCLSSGQLQHPLTSECCCGKTRKEETKYLIQAGIYDYNWVSPQDQNLIESFDLRHVL